MTKDAGTSSADLALAFVALNEHLSVAGDQQSALQRLVEFAVSSVPGCDWAAITAWPAKQQPHSLATSHAVAAAVDRLQYETGEGPCLTAAAESEVVAIPDLTKEDRWPRFTAAALTESPARAVLSFHLAEHPVRAALNLYGRTAGAFETDAVTVAALFAAHARVLLIHAASADKAVNLATALTTSRQIGAAIGILMNVHKITADEAFDLLRSSSQQLHRKLRDIADDVTSTGILPNGGD